MVKRIRHSPSLVDIVLTKDRFNSICEAFNRERDVGIVEFAETYLGTKYNTVREWRSSGKIRTTSIPDPAKMLSLVWEELLLRNIDQDILLSVMDKIFKDTTPDGRGGDDSGC